jgi:hypothetical protein
MYRRTRTLRGTRVSEQARPQAGYPRSTRRRVSVGGVQAEAVAIRLNDSDFVHDPAMVLTDEQLAEPHASTVFVS